ncbi:MAG: hypothetical protein JWM95_3515 [Gemmatimonadetes bacterium]|nr:hypothetical protein [Gemmatimonadota bacterium]
MIATSDALYLAGTYSNTYMNGAAPPPATSPAFVLKTDLNGQQLWFRTFRLMPANATQPIDFVPSALAIGHGKVAVYAANQALFIINAADGVGP